MGSPSRSPPPSSKTPEPERARRACEKCTRTKKKCDKALPKCGRCSRLSTTCCYNFYAPPTLASADLSFYNILQDDAFAVPTFAPSFPTTTQWPSMPVLAPAPPPASSPESTVDPELSTELSAQDLLAMISAQGLSWRDVLGLYNERIHHWIGIVHPEYFAAKISSLLPGQDPTDVETALLLLCMYLAVRPAEDGPVEVPFFWASGPPSRGSTPPPGARPVEPNHMLSSPLYRTAKRMLVLVRAFCPPSVELVQSGTLLALYELGHGDPWRAYVTFGEAIAMSKLIGVRPGVWDGMPENEPVDVHEDQMCSLYWALFVLDKMLHFDFAFVKCPLQMPLPPQDSLLPAQNQLWSAEGRHSVWRRIPYSAPHSTKRLGPFQRVIQAAVIAHRAMLWEETVRLSGRPSSSTRATFLDLDAQARSLVQVLVFEEQALSEDCEALSMCFGVMLMLHATVLGDSFDELLAPVLPHIGLLPGFSPHDAARVTAGINSVVRMVADSAADANARIHARPALAAVFSPTMVYTAYYALRALSTLGAEGAEGRFHDIYANVSALGSRWMLGGRLLGGVDAMVGGF